MRARLLEDCARNLRISYDLDVPVTVQLFEDAGAVEVIVNMFSEFVSGANDHITASFSPARTIRADAVVGTRQLVVTYGSLHAVASPDDVVEVERRLRHAIDTAHLAIRR